MVAFCKTNPAKFMRLIMMPINSNFRNCSLSNQLFLCLYHPGRKDPYEKFNMYWCETAIRGVTRQEIHHAFMDCHFNNNTLIIPPRVSSGFAGRKAPPSSTRKLASTRPGLLAWILLPFPTPHHLHCLRRPGLLLAR